MRRANGVPNPSNNFSDDGGVGGQIKARRLLIVIALVLPVARLELALGLLSLPDR